MSFRRHLLKVKEGLILPEWFGESIVCWYSPKLQGVTNENLATAPRLIDISGKGHDMTLYGFDGVEDAVVRDTWGKSVFFDGSRYGHTVLPALSDFTVIWKAFFKRYGDYGGLAVKKNAFDIYRTIYGGSGGEYCTEVFGGRVIGTKPNYETEVRYLIPGNFNGEKDIIPGTIIDTEGDLYLFKGRHQHEWNNSLLNGYGQLYNFILFNRTLRVDEINWVKKYIMRL